MGEQREVEPTGHLYFDLLGRSLATFSILCIPTCMPLHIASQDTDISLATRHLRKMYFLEYPAPVHSIDKADTGCIMQVNIGVAELRVIH